MDFLRRICQLISTVFLEKALECLWQHRKQQDITCFLIENKIKEEKGHELLWLKSAAVTVLGSRIFPERVSKPQAIAYLSQERKAFRPTQKILRVVVDR